MDIALTMKGFAFCGSNLIVDILLGCQEIRILLYIFLGVTTAFERADTSFISLLYSLRCAGYADGCLLGITYDCVRRTAY